ncbi:hypothetical protein CXB51_029389 [Gossypium anomalum]|uniref:Strictosidine synthase conserved region domain-containing protein n=1 Tax=Gossypium anomalum TaxID=47600 RepID=A0A8J5YGB0_9ROSI|nr:hypothetical protein CXB51_029389 [Gossypium anomalum]
MSSLALSDGWYSSQNTYLLLSPHSVDADGLYDLAVTTLNGGDSDKGRKTLSAKKTRLQHHSQNYTFAQFGETVLHFEKFGLLAMDSVLKSQAVGTMEGGGSEEETVKSQNYKNTRDFIIICFLRPTVMKKFVSFAFFVLFFFVSISSSNGDGDLVFQNYTNINLTKVIDGDGGVLFKNYSQINFNRVTGPESIAFDCKGEGPYVGISDGRILKWKPNFGWQEFAIPSPFRERKLCDGTRDSNVEPICGRPLGLKFDSRTCHLHIADAYFGLLVVGPNGGTAIRLAISAANGAPFKFTNGLDIDTSTGMVYFTDSSTLFQRRDADFLISSADTTGRLLKYNPYNGEVSVLHDGLAFPNGVAFSANNPFLLVNESIKRRILKFNVHDPKAAPKVFLELPRVPDNIKRNDKGEFWVALNSGRLGTLGNGVPDPIGMRFNEEAKVLEILDGKGAPTFNSISEVEEHGGKLYIGSVLKSYQWKLMKDVKPRNQAAMSSLALSDGWYSSQNTYLLLSPHSVDADGLYDLAVTTLNGGDSDKGRKTLSAKKTRLQHHSQNYTFAQFGETVLHFEKFGLLAMDSVLKSQAVGTMEGGGSEEETVKSQNYKNTRDFIIICFLRPTVMKKFVSFAFFVLFFFVSISSSNGDGDLVFQNYTNINLTKVIDGDGGVLFKNYSQINLNRVTGPESIAFDCKGEGPYVGISDGRILKWKPNFGWQEFAIPSPFRERKLCDGTRDSNVEPICGRPLGLKFDSRTCHLYIADAYFGLLVVGPNGGTAIRLAISAANGAPFKFTNGLDIDTSTGMVYFTDSSTLFQRRDADFLISSADTTGRLLKYNPYNGEVSVLHDGLAFPNGVAFSANNSFLLVNESIKRRILKFNVHDPKAAPKVFLELPRVPDNIKRNDKGEFWVALNSGRLGTLGNGVPDPIGMRFNEEAKVLEILDGKGAPTFNSISEVEEHGGKLYIGSVLKSYVGILNA